MSLQVYKAIKSSINLWNIMGISPFKDSSNVIKGGTFSKKKKKKACWKDWYIKREMNKEWLCKHYISDGNFVVACLFSLVLGIHLHKDKNIHINS